MEPASRGIIPAASEFTTTPKAYLFQGRASCLSVRDCVKPPIGEALAFDSVGQRRQAASSGAGRVSADRLPDVGAARP